MRRVAASVVGALLVLAASACGGGSSNGSGSAGSHITVFAASSLTDAFAAEGTAYKAAHPGSSVTFSFGASSDLATQVQQGAPADVIATASTTTMDTVTKQLASPPTTFARNKLVIVTEHGNPKHITTLADLARPDLAVVLAAAGVPAGDYARQALSDAHVTVQPKSLETDVRGVLTKVELGEADAGIVYVTDAKSAAGKVSSVPIPSAPIATYPIGAIDAKGKPFVDFVRSPAGAAILAKFGFLPS
jgi:molybdate transport system substrate-binding protein